jgi:hypothetical protein
VEGGLLGQTRVALATDEDDGGGGVARPVYIKREPTTGPGEPAAGAGRAGTLVFGGLLGQTRVALATDEHDGGGGVARPGRIKRDPSHPKPRAKPPKCTHGKDRRQCKECGGSSFCAHGRRRSTCKECGDPKPRAKPAKCTHGKERRQCKECGGASICAHGRRRHTCKDCGGASICVHGRQRSRCKECGGASKNKARLNQPRPAS